VKIKYFQNFYYPLFLFAIIIATIGLLNLYSATAGFDKEINSLFKAQVVYTGIGVFGMIIASMLSIKNLYKLTPFLYVGAIGLLVLVLVMGAKVHGAMSWLDLGFVRLQPSEFGKIGLILLLSRYLSGLQLDRSLSFSEIFIALIIFLVPTVLVVLQNDLGSSLFYGFLFITMIFVQGIRIKYIVIGLILLSLVSVISYQYILQPYQKNRIISFMNPELDPRGSGYHLVQSKIAVGSGGMSGKGYLKGESHRLKFLPERHTDFIFPVLAEEWGFVGSVFTLMMYFLFLVSGTNIATRAESRFGFFVSIGLVALFFWHLVINLGGVLGLLPLTGVPLPLLSYGGSSLVVNWLAIGTLLSVMKSRTMLFDHS
jgi:rod shape determining protein RodA